MNLSQEDLNMVIPPYGVAIRQSIADGDLGHMKQTLADAEAFLQQHGDVGAALELLKAEIAKLEGKGK
jgi:hypothetical protein